MPDDLFDYLKSIKGLVWDVPEEELRETLDKFVDEEIDPNEEAFRDD